jgi:hypothetical protein
VSGHTPGPWSFKPSESDPNLFQVLDAQGCVIGFVLRGDRAATRIVCGVNANLIAAAPELLDSLIYLRNCIESGTQPAMREVNAAIEKAIGAKL